MMITPLQLKAVFPKIHDPNAWVRIFTMELPTFEIDTPLRVAAWIAECGYESQSFNKVRESGSYTAKRLMEVWPHVFKTLADAKPYEYNPEGLLNFIYADRLGNGPSNSRDGTIYRGGGLIQLTGRANYREVGKGLGLRLEAQPKIIEQPNIMARTACYFWKVHDLNAAADAGDIDYITKKINGAMEGAEERRALYDAVLVQLKAPPAFRKGAPPPVGDFSTKPTPSFGPAPGPVAPGTLDGMHTPGSYTAVSTAAAKEAMALAFKQPEQIDAFA